MARRRRAAGRGFFLALCLSALAGGGAAAGGQAVSTPADPSSPAPGELERALAGRPVIRQALTLDEAVGIALRESPVVRGAQEEIAAAVGRLDAARAETRPWLSANTFVSGGSNGNIVSTPAAAQPQMIMGLPRDAFFDQNLMLMVPLYTGGRLGAMVRQAAAMRNASLADLAAQRQEIALMTRMAYRDAQARQALIAVAADRLKADRERLRTDQDRFRQGAVAVLTVRRDEAEEAAAEQGATNAERDFQISLVQLKTVMGVHPASQLMLTSANGYEPSTDFLARLGTQASGGAQPAPPSEAAATPAELAPLLRLAERQRPELQAASERVRGAQQDTAAARSAFLPQVNLFAMGDFMQGRSVNAFAGTTYGLVASWPLYNGGERHAHVRTAEAERRRQEQDRERVALQIAQEVQVALLSLRSAEQNIRTARSAQAAAEEGYRETLQRYQAGRSINVEVLDALAARTEAQSNAVQALYQFNVAQDQLLRAVGALGGPLPVPSAAPRLRGKPNR